MASTLVSSITPQSATVGDPSFTMTVRGNGFTSGSALQFGGQQMTTVFVDANQVLATIPSSSFPTASLGGLNVNVMDNGQLSNSVSFTVQDKSPVTLNQLQEIANSITMPDISTLVAEANPYILPVNNVQVYRVTQGDLYQGLQGVAQQVMGDATKWDQIAFINNLRYPFISEDPTELEGKAATSLYLANRVNVGDTVVYVNGISPFLTEGAILFFALQSLLSDGSIRTISDVVRVESVGTDPNNSTNTRLTLQQPIFNVYLAGTAFDVLDTSNNTSSRVVTIGDFILIPSPLNSNNALQARDLDITQVYALLGQDLWLDNNGLLRNDQNGDLQTVVGVYNLHQAVVHRLVTEIGELVYHQDYGNPLLKYVGKVNSPVLTILANQKLSQTLLDDPRIKSVQQIFSVAQGDVLYVKASVTVNLFNRTTELNFVLPAN